MAGRRLKRLLAGNSNDMIFKPNAATRLDPPRAPSGPDAVQQDRSARPASAPMRRSCRTKQIGIVMLANKGIPTPARVTAALAVLEQIALR